MNPKDPRNFLRLLEKNMLEQFYPEKIGFWKDRTTKSAAIGEVSVFLRKLWSERNKLSNFHGLVYAISQAPRQHQCN